MPVVAQDRYDQGIKEEHAKARLLEEKELEKEVTAIRKKEEEEAGIIKEEREEFAEESKISEAARSFGRGVDKTIGYAKASGKAIAGTAKGVYKTAKKPFDAGAWLANKTAEKTSIIAADITLFLIAVITVHIIDAFAFNFNNFLTRFWLYMGLTLWYWLGIQKAKPARNDIFFLVAVPVILSYIIEFVPFLQTPYLLIIFILAWMISGIYIASEELKMPLIVSAVALLLPYVVDYLAKTNAQIPLGYLLIWLPVWVVYLFFLAGIEGGQGLSASFYNLLKFSYVISLVLFLILPTVASTLSVPAYADFIKVNINTDTAVKTMKDNLKTSVGFITKTLTGGISSVQKAYSSQIYYATHGYYPGETEQTKQFVGIHLLEPALQNRQEYSIDEKFFETRTAVEAYNPKQKFKVDYSCSSQSDECIPLTVIPVVAKYAGSAQCSAKKASITPRQELVLAEQNYYTEATCYPELELGWNSVNISVTLDDFTTESRLTSYFIDFDAMNQIVKNYRREKNIQTPVEVSQIPAFSSVRNVKTVSVSDPGPIKLIISIPSQQPLIGVKSEDNSENNFPVVVAVEQNTEFGVAGEVLNVREVTLSYPEGLEPQFESKGESKENENRCAAYEKMQDKNLLRMKNNFLSGLKITFTYTPQAVLPSCYFAVSDEKKFLSSGMNIPNPRTFIANVTYDYKVTKQFKVKYGEKPKEGAGTTGGTGGGTGGTGVGGCAPSGSQIERVIQIARSEGLDDEGVRMVLKVGKKESILEHYSPPGSEKVKVSHDLGYGIMQITVGKNQHPNCIQTIKYVSGSDDLCTGASLCNGKNVEDIDCNIQAGVRFLKSLYQEAIRLGGKQDPCGGKTLTGWNYAFRAYNGWVCNNYVDEVNSQDISAYEKSISEIQYCRGEATTLSVGAGTCSGDLVSIDDGVNTAFKLRKTAADQFKVAQQKAKEKGYNLRLTDAYRTEQQQANYWNLYISGKGNIACGPDEKGSYSGCPHVSGCAVDIANPYSEISQSVLDEIMYSSDWVRYAKEDWHYEYGTTSWQTAKAKGERTYG